MKTAETSEATTIAQGIPAVAVSRRRLYAWTLCLLASACAFEEPSNGCGGESITNNYRFDRWCGDHLCGWETEQGTIRPAPTWHEHELGVELVDNPTVLSQVRTLKDIDCLAFELIGDVELSASVELALDYNLDGSFEVHQLPVARWEPVRFLLPTPVRYSGVRFEVRKLGDGRAILAELRAVEAEGCVGERPPSVNLPNGVECGDASECVSQLCAPLTVAVQEDWLCDRDPETCPDLIAQLLTPARSCSTCDLDADCDPGEFCGFAQAQVGTYRECQGQVGLGDKCASDAQCSEGWCRPSPLSAGWIELVAVTPMCSNCRDDADCDADQVCGLNPGHLGAACVPRAASALDATCAVDAECASGICCGLVCSECCEATGNEGACTGSQQCVDKGCE